MKEPIYTWNAETGKATCTIVDTEGRKFVGVAKCAPEDTDFCSELVGSHIAAMRATILYLRSVKRDVIQPELNGLRQLYFSINKSKKYNPKSYEATMLHRQIALRLEDLATIEEQIAAAQQQLKLYLSQKDALYKHLRTKRLASNPPLDGSN